ncbi:hypothetical protein [Streptomyces sp. NPDC058142]|uniref:hypothetical protein n=1 Tax=Streptomyces sp. NPDC058142 TaxID=3346355 RepID=UPI0036E41CAA
MQAQQGFDQWLRERRQEAYAALLSAGDAVDDALNTVIGHTIAPVEDAERRAAWRAVNAALRGFDRAGRTAEIVSLRDVVTQRAAMREALYEVVSVWRDPTIHLADQRAIAYADADRAWKDHSTRYLALIQKDMQTFGGD